MSEAFNKLANEAAHARRENRVSDAQRLWRAAAELSRQSRHRRQLIEALKGCGQIERDMGDNEKALAFYQEAAALCREEHDALLLAHTVRHLGDVYRSAGKLDAAESSYEEALRIYRNHQEAAPLDFANALRPMAILKEQKGQADAAKPIWEEARRLYEAANVSEGVAESSKRLERLAAKR